MRTTLLALAFLVACGQHHTRPDTATFCGGFTGRPCAATEFCDYPNDECGFADQTGTCKPRPEVCTTIFLPVCACDGKVYPNQCVAQTKGLDVNARGTCEVPSGSFACGFLQCNQQTQYCLHEPRASGPDRFTCAELPAACASQPPACACLASERCGNTCSGNGSVGLTLTCP